MRPSGPFRADDLSELRARLLDKAAAVVAMESVHHRRGHGPDVVYCDSPLVIGMRHDVDDNRDSLWAALQLARWEYDSGFCSTYYLLHTASYWGPEMLNVARLMESMGHEVGLHLDGVTAASRLGGEPIEHIEMALDYLRSAGLTVTGCAAHGAAECRYPDRSLRFVNDEVFLESPRPEVGDPDRTFELNGRGIKLRPVSRASLGLEYDAAWLSKGDYLSDSGNRWSQDFDDVVARYPTAGQLHILQHPDWWPEAFR